VQKFRYTIEVYSGSVIVINKGAKSGFPIISNYRLYYCYTLRGWQETKDYVYKYVISI